MGCGVGEGEDRALTAVRGALESPLLSENNIEGASHILLNITSGTQEILMDEISQITSYIQEEAGQGADMIWGHCNDETLGNKIMVTLIATGFEGKSEAQKAPTVFLTLDEKPSEQVPTAVLDTTIFTNTMPKEETPWEPVLKQEEVRESNTPSAPKQAGRQAIIFEEQEDNEASHELFQGTHRYNDNRTPNQNLNDLEKVPAYIRKRIKLQNIPHSSESNISRLNLVDDIENDTVSITQKNSYLHDNVD